MVENNRLEVIRFSISSILITWTDVADYNNDFTDENFDDWMDAIIPIILKLKGKAAAIKHVKRLVKKTGQSSMSKENMFKFLERLNSELVKWGFVQ